MIIDRKTAKAIHQLAIDAAAKIAADRGEAVTAQKIRKLKPDWEAIAEIVLAPAQKPNSARV